MTYKLVDIEHSGLIQNTSNQSFDFKNHVIQFIERLGDKSFDALILTSWCEEYDNPRLQQIQNFIDIVKNNFSFKIILILGEHYKRTRYIDPKYEIIKFTNIDDMCFVQGLLYKLYVKIFDHKICEPSDVYLKKPENKFLLLIGKPHEHRIRLLYKLYKKDLLKHCLWRFKIHNKYVYDECRHMMSDISKEEFDEFLQKCEKDLDNVNVLYQWDSSHYSGIPFERWVWDETMFQVIPESGIYDNWITEKTWLAIINKMPFISAAQIYHNKDLRNLGFRTFEKYLLHKEYNDIDLGNLDERLNQIVENIEYWVENIDKHYEEIKLDVEHNFNIYRQLVQQQEKKLQYLIDKHELNCKPENLMVGYYA